MLRDTISPLQSNSNYVLNFIEKVGNLTNRLNLLEEELRFGKQAKTVRVGGSTKGHHKKELSHLEIPRMNQNKRKITNRTPCKNKIYGI